MKIVLQYSCDEPTRQTGTITFTETDAGDLNVDIDFHPALQPGTPSPFGILNSFIGVLDKFETPNMEDESDAGIQVPVAERPVQV